MGETIDDAAALDQAPPFGWRRELRAKQLEGGGRARAGSGAVSGSALAALQDDRSS
jgi:hypothetical protein